MRSRWASVPYCGALAILAASLAGCENGGTESPTVSPTASPATAVDQAAGEKAPVAEANGNERKPNVVSFKPGPDVQRAVQEELILAEPGTVIQFEEGRFEFTSGLSLAVDDVTIRGAGKDKTFLSFKNQEAGAEGLYITGDRAVIEDFAIEDTKGNGLKSHEANDIVIRRLHVEWTGGPKSTNGGYGIYSVVSTNNLIEDCVAIGASDAGIYVGQSKNIKVVNCRVELNVAGIEIENCYGGEAYNNVATRNTGGILVFDLPDLPMRRGHNISVHHNRIFDNNTPNFAPKGNIVATVPTGTGMMIMANENVEAYENEVRDHGTVNLLINSYVLSGLAINDPNYYPYPRRIHIHHNTFGPCGNNPGGDGGAFVAGVLGTPLPDIIWDGVFDSKEYDPKQENPDLLVCIHDNKKEGGEVGFANLGGAATLADPTQAKITRDLAAYAGEMPPVETVVPVGGKE